MLFWIVLVVVVVLQLRSINTNREFIGCELDEEYFTKSMERINELTGVNRFI